LPKLDYVAVDKAVITPADTHYLYVMRVRGANDGPNRRVHAGRVAAACKYADTPHRHMYFPLNLIFLFFRQDAFDV
jgi:hypothetical protein